MSELTNLVLELAELDNQIDPIEKTISECRSQLEPLSQRRADLISEVQCLMARSGMISHSKDSLTARPIISEMINLRRAVKSVAETVMEEVHQSGQLAAAGMSIGGRSDTGLKIMLRCPECGQDGIYLNLDSKTFFKSGYQQSVMIHFAMYCENKHKNHLYLPHVWQPVFKIVASEIDITNPESDGEA